MNTAIAEAMEAIGGFRAAHSKFMFKIGGTVLTWTELGSDMRVCYYFYGRYMADPELSKGYMIFADYMIETLDATKIAIRDYILDHYEVPEEFDEEAVIEDLEYKTEKSIFYGSTYPQIVSFLDKQFDAMSRGMYGGKR